MAEFKYIESKRVSKSQRRREAKEAKKVEQFKRIEEAEKLDEYKDRRLEQESLDSILTTRGLKIYNIEADGDCMYRAVEHQLEQSDDADERMTSQELRLRTSRYMLDNSNEFKPFLLNDDGDLMDDQGFKNYCKKIATTREWGGHLELTAISRITKKPIHIFQAYTDQPIEISPEKNFGRKPMLLSFHKNLYHLGEHYNSLVPAS